MPLNLLVLLGERRRPRVAWGEVAPILASAVPGVVCGVLILRLLPKPALQVGVGTLMIAAALLRARRGRLAALHSHRFEPLPLTVIVFAGVASVVAGVSAL